MLTIIGIIVTVFVLDLIWDIVKPMWGRILVSAAVVTVVTKAVDALTSKKGKGGI